MTQRVVRRAGSICLVIGLLIAVGNESMAHDFRTNLIPNGNVFSCNTCHIIPGGPRNAFGMEVEKLVTPGGRQPFWSPELAAKDSDLDGISNGAELLDPAGTWSSGSPNPGAVKDVTNPGDPTSFHIPTIAPGGESYLCKLSGDHVVPPVETPARGLAILELYAGEMKLDYYLNVFDINSITAAHIHLGGPMENGGVIHPLATPVNGVSMGTLMITAGDIDNLRNGEFYVQVHTQQHPAGELRGQADDEMIVFEAHLSGSQEVPPNTSAGMGMARATLSRDLKKLSYTVDISGLNNVTAAHFHVGMAGANGGVVIPIASGAFTQVTGEADVTPDILANLLAEKLYVNVHSTAFPAGEIRGQVRLEAKQEPSAVVDWNLYQ